MRLRVQHRRIKTWRMALGHSDLVAKDTVKVGRGLEIQWRTWHKLSILRITCLQISELVPIKATCIIRDFIWLSRSLPNNSSSTLPTNHSWDMVKLREALLVFQALMLVISPQQPNQEDHHSSTSLNPLRTSAGIQLAAFNKTVEHLEAPASEEASLTISRDLTAAQTKLPSTKAILCLSGTKQR